MKSNHEEDGRKVFRRPCPGGGEVGNLRTDVVAPLDQSLIELL